MDWRSFVFGAIAGWVAELIIDWFFWRRGAGDDAALAELETQKASLQRELAQLKRENETRQADLASRNAGLEKDLAQLSGENAARQAELSAQVGRLEEELADMQRANATLQAQLETQSADQAECRQALAEANAQAEGLRTELAEMIPANPDDLKKIEGIGPKIEELLRNGGIYTYRQLAWADTSRLNAILEAGGKRFALAEPDTWPEQAGLAQAGDWDGLAKLQDELKGGSRNSL